MIGIAAPNLGLRERQYVAEAVASGWLSSRGPFVERFETTFAHWCGVTHGVSCSSGTAAIHLALASLRIGAGDEVIVPAFTMIGSVNPVSYVGATPVVCDVLPDTWNIDPEAVRQALTPRTRAILVTHVYGMPADVDEVRRVAPGVPIVSDAAEAHGALSHGRRAGALADISAFSFYANKILTTGEGGMVVTRRDDLAARCRSLRDHAFGGDESRYEHAEVGFSYRMSNLQAAVGLAQAERADELVAAAQGVAARYHAGLADHPALEFQRAPGDAISACWVFGVVVREDSGIERDAVRAALRARGVESRAFFHPIHRQPAYPALAGAQCPVAERLGRRGLYLPSGPGRSLDEVDEVVRCLREVLKGEV